MPDNPNPNTQPDLTQLTQQVQNLTGLVTTLQTTVTDQQTQLAAAQTRNAELELTLRTREAAEKVRSLIAAGKILQKQAEHYEKLALSNAELFDQITGALEPVVQLNTERGTSGHRPPTEAAVGMQSTGDPALDQRIATAEGDDAIQLMSSLVEKHRKENPNTTFAVAMHAVGNAYPDLVERYRAAFVTSGSPGQVQ